MKVSRPRAWFPSARLIRLVVTVRMAYMCIGLEIHPFMTSFTDVEYYLPNDDPDINPGLVVSEWVVRHISGSISAPCY